MKRPLPLYIKRKYPVLALIISLLFFVYPMVSLKVPDLMSVQTSPRPTSIQTVESVVKRVIDGDTIELEGGQRVRYIGINTGELSTGNTCFGKEAQAKNKELVEGKTVRLVKDVSETDKYGRMLRYVYTGDVFVNAALVEEGFAQVSTYPPDVAHKDEFVKAQQRARESNRGLWSGCPSANDAVWQESP